MQATNTPTTTLPNASPANAAFLAGSATPTSASAISEVPDSNEPAAINPAIDGPASCSSRTQLVPTGRLAEVTAEDLLRESITGFQPPRWLRILNLPNSRTNVRCLLPRTRFAKRVLDIVVASGLLIVALPVMLAAAVLIKCTSPGPVLFSQIRVGLNTRRKSASARSQVAGDPSHAESDAMQASCRRSQANFGKPFRIYKLRTMHVGVDAAGPNQAQANDRRIIPAGRLLRKMRIDELPQLFNVLRGEMSMVGPRPECIEYMEELSTKVPGYLDRLGLKPGLTGIAQTEAGYANDLESYRRKVAFDLLYLQNCCLWNDLKILLRTVRVVLTGFGAL